MFEKSNTNGEQGQTNDDYVQIQVQLNSSYPSVHELAEIDCFFLYNRTPVYRTKWYFLCVTTCHTFYNGPILALRNII